MSRQSGSSRHRSHGSSSRSTDGNSEDLVEQVKNIVTQLYDVVGNSPDEWETYLASARSAVTALDHLRFFRDPQRFAEQVWILHGLQDYAFHEPDSGSIRDIAEWAQASWLKVLRNYPESDKVLTGLAHNWLQSAQATLARIAREEGNDSSSSGSGQAGNILRGCEAMDEGSETYEIAATTSSDPRRQGPLYVEARGFLQPAVDFYARAVRSADALGTTSGELLAQAAESQMSLGNVTATPGDERYFTQAIRYLRRAEATPGYDLSIYLQQYLNEYGRYVS